MPGRERKFSENDVFDKKSVLLFLLFSQYNI